MRRMISGPVLFVPNEHNKVFCAQFVADELIAEHIKPGLYAVQATDTVEGTKNDLMIYNFNETIDYNGPAYYDSFDQTYGFWFSYNRDLEILTVGYATYTGSEPSSNFHIDIFKLD